MRRGLAVLAVCASLPACLSAPPASTDDAGIDDADAAILESRCGDPVFEDRFSASTLDQDAWVPGEGGIGTDIRVSQGVLHLEANPAGSGYAFARIEGTESLWLADHVAYVTSDIDFTGAGHAFFGWLVETEAPAEPVYVGVQATIDPSDGTTIGVLQQNQDGTGILAFCGADPCTPYDPGAQRVWKIVTTADTISFYASSDTIEWAPIFEGHALPGMTGTLALWSDSSSGGTRNFIDEVRVYDCAN